MVDCDFQEAQVIKNLSDFIAELVSEGDLCLARALRTKFIQKYEEHRTRLLPDLDFGRISVNGNTCTPLQSLNSLNLHVINVGLFSISLWITLFGW